MATKKSCTIYSEHIESLREVLSEAEQMAFYNALFDFLMYGKEAELQGITRAMWIAYAPFYRKQRTLFENGLKGAGFGYLGGAKEGNQNARKQPQKQPQNDPKIKESKSISKNKSKSKNIVVEDNKSAQERANNNSNNDEFNVSNEEINITELLPHLTSETTWVEALCMNLHKERAYILQRLNEFCTEQQTQGVICKPLSDAKRHFRFWLQKVEQIEAAPGRAATTTSVQPYRVYTYTQILDEINTKGGTTSDFATLFVDGQEKPLWVRRTDKEQHNIPDRVAELPQISANATKRWSC